MPYKMTIHDPDDITRTTKKEMNINYTATKGKVQPNDFFLLCK